MKQVSFSIITCTYNAESVLQRTLDSVRQQTYPHIQHIIVDGASKDRTMQMVEEYGDATVISEKDNGLYDAMNKGIGMAEGDYLVFLNAGDCLASPTTIEELARQVSEGYQGKALPGVIYGNTMTVDDNGKELGLRRLQPPPTLTWRSFSNGMLVCHQAFYARTDIAKRTPYDLRYRISSDVDWCIRIMKESENQGLKLHNSNMVLCRYLAGGMSIKNHRASLFERFDTMRRHYGLITTIIKHISFLFR